METILISGSTEKLEVTHRPPKVTDWDLLSGYDKVNY